MYHKPLSLMVVALAAAAIACASRAQESPISTPSQGSASSTYGETPTTEANVESVIAKALEAAKRPDFKGYNSTEAERRVTSYPALTLKRLKPYALHPNAGVRLLVRNTATGAINHPDFPGLNADALSILVQVLGSPFSSASFAAEASLYDYLFDEELRKLVDTAALKSALLRFLSQTYTDKAVLMLTLLSSDTSLKPFVDKLAKREDYKVETLVAQSAWGDGNAIGALKDKIERGEDVNYLALNIRAVNEPNVLGALWKRLDDKTKIGEYRAAFSPNFNLAEEGYNAAQKLVPFRVCDLILTAFRQKIDAQRVDLQHPPPATDAELAAAKEKYRALINALPQIGDQIDDYREPL